MLRSVQPNITGTPVSGTKNFISDQESPLNERWGGWYVSGPLARKTLANLAAPADATARSLQLDALPETFEPTDFLAPGSDAVALLVLGHQTQMHNLITLTNYRTRIALHDAGLKAGDEVPADLRQRFEKPAEQLLRYLLFANETRLPDLDGAQVLGDSGYARQFAERGPFDSKGRSLRQFDLNTRIFKYPCSYLIYSDAFDALPEPAKGYVYHRLLEVLSGEDQGADFASLSAGTRRDILEILLQTKSGLPQEWTDYARTHQLRVADRTTSAKRSTKWR
jgi:hypothetical protein